MEETLKQKLTVLSQAIGSVKEVFHQFEDELKDLNQQKVDVEMKIKTAEQSYKKMIESLTAEKNELEKSVKEEMDKLKDVKEISRQIEIQTKKDSELAKHKLAEIEHMEDQIRDRKIEIDALKKSYEDKLDAFNKLSASIK